MSVVQPVILSGGAGTRLWPASRAMYPKQLLSLVGQRTMLQETALRLDGKANLAGSTMVVCNEAHRFLVAEQLLEVDVESRIVLEPEGKNTAPAVALAALLALRDAPDGESPLLLVMPADHVIDDPGVFAAAVERGEASAEAGKLVLFGIVPTMAHTGYGYIESEANPQGTSRIRSFTEKPDKKTAIRMLKSSYYFWNAGIFLFRADRYLEELERFAPEIVAACRNAVEGAVENADFIRPDAEAFRAAPSDSIDYAVMEKTDVAEMVPLEAGWSDVGSWAELHMVSDKDADGNVISGDVVIHDCRNNYISSSSRLVAAVGLQNVIVVEDKDAVLVAARERSQEVKELVDQLRSGDREETNLPRQVFRPWGSYDGVDSGDGFQVKRLIVNPGAVLSLQKHARRAEHWTVVRGKALITLDDKEFELGVDESTYVPIGAVHRIANPFDEPVHIIEVQCGDYLGEDDIVRLEDNYGREGTTS